MAQANAQDPATTDASAAPDVSASASSPPPAAPPASGPSSPAGHGFLERLPWYAVPAILVGLPLLVALAVQVEPAVYDDFVWKYYAGPIRSDAENFASMCLGTDGSVVGDREAGFRACSATGVVAESGYNVVNTASWALLLGLCILGIAQMLRKYDHPMDDRLIVGATAWVVIGSLWHVLEDTGLFLTPLQYLFITPPIYLLFGLFGILSFLAAQYLKSVEKRASLDAALQKLWFHHMILAVLYLFAWMRDWGQVTHYVNPIWVALFLAANFFVVRALWKREGHVDAGWLVLGNNVAPLLLAIAYLLKFQADPWLTPDNAMPSALWIAPALAGGAVLVTYLVAGSLKGVAREAYRKPINLLIVFAQSLDGFATALGIDLAGYSEKHVLSAKVIQVARNFGESQGIGLIADYPTFCAFVPLKIAISLLVIHAIDVSGRDDARTHPVLIGLVKFAIIMVGIGPGIRDFVRLAVGV